MSQSEHESNPLSVLIGFHHFSLLDIKGHILERINEMSIYHKFDLLSSIFNKISQTNWYQISVRC